MVKITEEYMVDPNQHSWATLRHFCPATQSDLYSRKEGYTAYGGKCLYCRKETPEKIQFIYNLWKWHNG